LVVRAEKSSIAGHEHKVYFACWDQHGIRATDLLDPSMGCWFAGRPAYGVFWGPVWSQKDHNRRNPLQTISISHQRMIKQLQKQYYHHHTSLALFISYDTCTRLLKPFSWELSYWLE